MSWSKTALKRKLLELDGVYAELHHLQFDTPPDASVNGLAKQPVNGSIHRRRVVGAVPAKHSGSLVIALLASGLIHRLVLEISSSRTQLRRRSMLTMRDHGVEDYEALRHMDTTDVGE